VSFDTLKRRLAPAVCNGLVNLGFHRLTKPFFSGLGQIINLHRVQPPSDRERLTSVSSLEVSPEWLAGSIDWYRANGFEVVSLDEVFAILHNAAPVRPFVAYTFDDGFVDNFTEALPIFEAKRAPFAVYLAAGFPDRKVVPWWQLLEDLILSRDRLEVRANGKELTLDCSTENAREASFFVLRTLVLESGGRDYQGTRRDWCEPHGIEVDRYNGDGMSWDQVREMARHPLVTIGGHTVHHLPLAMLDEHQMREEVVGAKRLIEEQTGKPVDHFAYPYGARTEAGEREFEAVRKAGYRTAVTTRPANVFAEHQLHPFAIPRNLISGGREGLNHELLRLWTSGTIPALENRLARVVGA